MTTHALFDTGEPVKVVKTAEPMPERFFVVAYLAGDGNGSGYWAIKSKLKFTREAAEKEAAGLANCWVERRVYRIPGDVP